MLIRPVRVVHLRDAIRWRGWSATPTRLLDIGELVAIIYRADKLGTGRPQTYIHAMQRPPTLKTNAQGTQLYIVGGNYRVTKRGIEG